MFSYVLMALHDVSWCLYITLEDPFHFTYTHLPQHLFFSSHSTSFQPTSSRILLWDVSTRDPPAGSMDGSRPSLSLDPSPFLSLLADANSRSKPGKAPKRSGDLHRRPDLKGRGGGRTECLSQFGSTLSQNVIKHDSIPQVMILTHPCLPNTM